MKTYNKIRNLIEHGHWVACEDKDGYWKVFLFVNGKGRLEGTEIGGNITDSMDYGLRGINYSEQRFEEKFTDNYKVVTPAPKLLKAGDKVEILENVRELPGLDDWFDEKKEMIGQKGFEIRSFDIVDYEIFTKDKRNSYSFPHWAVAPCYEDEEETYEQETLSGKEVTVTIDGVEHVAVIK